jgi:hypothetical protein
MANEIFVKGLQAKYNALDPKSATTIYFTTDTRSLYVGGVLYTEPVRLYTGALPATPAVGVLYFNTDTGLGSVYNGVAWTVVLKPNVTVIDEGATNDVIAPALAVKNFVEAAIESAIEEVTGGSSVVAGVASKSGSNGTLEVTKGDGSVVEAPLTGIAHDPVWDSANLKLTIPVVGSSNIIVNIPKDQFVESGAYDSASKEIVLTMKQGGSVRIPASDFVDIYTSGSGANDTVAISVSSDNKISAAFAVDTTGALGIASNGKLTIDLSGYATSARAGAIETRMTSAEGAINTLNGNAQTAGSVAKAVADAVAGVSSAVNAIDERLDAVEAALVWGTIA